MLHLKKIPVESHLAENRRRGLISIQRGSPCVTSLAHSPKAFSYTKGETNRVFLGWEWEVKLKGSDTMSFSRPTHVKEFGEDGINEYASPHVDSGDLEITSIPATLEYHRKKFKETILKTKNFYPAVVGGTGDDTTTWIGIHVHIDRRAFTCNSLRKFLAFMANPANFSFLEEIAGRNYKPPKCNFKYDANGRIEDILVNKAGKKQSIDSYRKKMVNLSSENLMRVHGTDTNYVPYGTNREVGATRCSALSITDTRHETVEVRMFKSVSSPELFFKNLEFCDALVRYCRVSSISNLYAKEFVNWANEETRKDSYRNLLTYKTCQKILKQK